MRGRAAVHDVDFEGFFLEAEPILRRAFVGRFGPEVGREATAEALTAAWRTWAKVRSTDNRIGYVYRIGERWAQRRLRKTRTSIELIDQQTTDRYSDPDVGHALDKLSDRQRQAVVLVHGYGMSHQSVADLLGCRRSSVQNHVERGLHRLRNELQVITDA